jgi:hypothetical protein
VLEAIVVMPTPYGLARVQLTPHLCPVRVSVEEAPILKRRGSAANHGAR